MESHLTSRRILINDPCFQTLHDTTSSIRHTRTKPFLASWIDTTADMDQDAGVASPPWAELPAEVLGEVARHLHDAANFMRFHAACRAWRAASSSAPARLYPWLVAPCGLFSSGMCFRWPFSPGEGKGGAYLPHFPALRGRRFDSTDAASGRVLAAGTFDDDRTASLVNPLTGDAAPLPPLPCAVARGPAWSRGVFCSNGAVLCDTTVGRLVEAVLQPGEADWEEIHVASPVGLGLRDVLRLDEHDRRAAALCSSTVASCCASTSWT